MRILSVRVRNFRMHADRTVDFDRERTVVAGPNESGKSTLVEAIERVLCYPHRSTADNLDAIKPRAGGGPPEVVLRFERHGRTYEIQKIFRGPQSVARLTDDAGNQFGGDDAEERLREILGFGDGPLRTPVRGWSHLWARQGEAGDDPTDGDALGAAARDLDARLKGMTGTTLTESERDTATFDRIAAEHDATFTQSGAARAGSPLGVASAELESAREAATEAGRRLADCEAAADAVVREEALIAEGRGTLADAEHQLAELQESLVQIEIHERSLAAERTRAEEAAAAHAGLEAGDAEIETVTRDIDARAKALADREQEIERLVGHEQRLQSAVADCLDVIEKSNASQRAVAAEEEFLKAVGRVFDLETVRAGLTATLEHIAGHRAAIATIDARLHDLPGVDRRTVEDLEDLDRRLEIVRGKLEASSTRIEVLVAGAAVAVDGKPLAAGESKTLTNPAEVTIGEVTRLQVMPGGGESLIELRAEAARLTQALAARLGGLGLRVVADARATLDARAAEEAGRERLREKVDALDGDDVQRRCDAAGAEIRRHEAEIERRMTEGFARPVDAAAVEGALRGLEGRRSQADEAVRLAHASFDASGGELKQTRQAREALQNALTGEHRDLRDLHVQKAALERVHGTDRKARLRQLAEDRAAKQDVAAATERRLAALLPDKVREDKSRFERTVKVTSEQIAEAGRRKANAEGRLSGVGTTDVHGLKAAAEARLDIARRRHAEVLQRAQAVRRLRDLFVKRRQAVAELVAAPLRAKVAEYLDQLYGSGSRITLTKTGDGFEELAVTRQSAGNQRFAFDELSGGTREQVAAACRLAMAEVLAADGGAAGCLPMVFDDAFVNADPERIKGVHRVLELGARRGLQIIVLSCNPQEYGLFGAVRVDLPPPQQPEASLPGGGTADSTTEGAVAGGLDRMPATGRDRGLTGPD